MKKLCKIVLVLFVMMAGSSFAALAEEEADSTPSRVLNVVYDDSGSMLINGDTGWTPGVRPSMRWKCLRPCWRKRIRSTSFR